MLPISAITIPEIDPHTFRAPPDRGRLDGDPRAVPVEAAEGRGLP